MPKIVPIRELKNTASISKFVEESDEPVFVTKNGYGSMVLMSLEVYEKEFAKNQQIELINEGIKDYNNSKEKNDESMFFGDLIRKHNNK